MADQKRWFKVWTSILDNPEFKEMSLEDIGRWLLLGASTALNGDEGRLEVPGNGRHLCDLLRVDDLAAAQKTLNRIPSVVFEEPEKRHGARAVTWRNWHKYQVDTTMADRARASRSKKRGEEKRRDPPPPAPCPAGGEGDALFSTLRDRESREAAREATPVLVLRRVRPDRATERARHAQGLRECPTCESGWLEPARGETRCRDCRAGPEALASVERRALEDLNRARALRGAPPIPIPER